MLAIADSDWRLRGGIRIRQDVIEIDSRIAIGDQALEHQPRRNGQPLNRLEQHRDAAAGPVAIVDILFDVAARLDCVNEPGQMVVVAHEAYRRYLTQRALVDLRQAVVATPRIVSRRVEGSGWDLMGEITVD